MLETMKGATMCGVIQYNDTWCEVYCDPYGTLAFDNYTDGEWCITEVNVENPLALTEVKSLVRNIEDDMYGKCIGVIYSADGDIVVLLDDSNAVNRKVWAPTEDVGEKFFYSTDEEYDNE